VTDRDDGATRPSLLRELAASSMCRKEASMSNHAATAEAEIAAPPGRVWAALTDPEQIKEYMFGSEVVTDWAK
jgi:hypothetical protein